MKTEYLQNPPDFVNAVEKFSKSKLKRKAELLRIYEEALKFKKESLFEDLTFTAKYVRGLLRIIKSGKINPGSDNIDRIKEDFLDNMNKIVKMIKEILYGAGDDLNLHFDQTYFESSQEGFLNINELLSDMEWVKIYMNNEKRALK
jgi:hypothetical protein